MSDSTTIDPGAQAVMDFWFGSKGLPEYGEHRDIWFRGGTPEFDAEIRERFLTTHEMAAAGKLEHWKQTAEGCLALTIVLDQFPRNMFRRSARVYSTDGLALTTAKHAIDLGFDLALPPMFRGFFYLPFEHAENLADQERGVELMPRTERPRSVKAAKEHRDIVARFDRFPHRNPLLGRDSTPEEIAYMEDGGKSFGQGDKPDPPPEDDDD